MNTNATKQEKPIKTKKKIILRAEPAQAMMLLEWLRDKNVSGAYIAQELKMTEATVCRWYKDIHKPNITVKEFNKLKNLARTVRDGYK